MGSNGRHFCGGIIEDAEISCDLGVRDGARLVLFLPGFYCSTCQDTMLSASELDRLEAVLAGGSYQGIKHLRLPADPPSAEPELSVAFA